MATKDRRGGSRALPALLVLLLGLSCARAQVSLPADGDVTAASAAASSSAITLAAVVAPFSGGVPLSGGITDPELLALIGQLSDDTANITVAAQFRPGPARGRYTADGTLVAAGPRPSAAAADEVAAAAAVDIAQASGGKIDNQMCIVANAGQNACLASPSGRFRLCLQGDSNIVLYDGNTPYWASNTVGRMAAGDFPAYFCAQADGNVVVRKNVLHVSMQRHPFVHVAVACLSE
jgi:hypothetical protein